MCRFPVFIDWVTEKINIEKISYENQYSQFWPFFKYFLCFRYSRIFIQNQFTIQLSIHDPLQYRF